MIAVAVTAYLLGALGACCVLWPALRAASIDRDHWHASRERWRDAYYGECDRHDATLARLRQLDAEPPAAAAWDAPDAVMLAPVDVAAVVCGSVLDRVSVN